MGAVDTLIVWENLDITRYTMTFKDTNATIVKYLTTEQAKNRSHFTDGSTGQDHDLNDTVPLLEWLADKYKSFGCTLELVTDKSQEGLQFVRGFGGIGGLLRYQVDIGDEYSRDANNHCDIDSEQHLWDSDVGLP